MSLRNSQGQFVKNYKMPKEWIEKRVRPKGLKYNIRVKNRTWFKKGHQAWSKIHKELMKPNSGSFKKGEHCSSETEFKKGQNAEEKKFQLERR